MEAGFISRISGTDFTSIEFYMFGAAMLFLGVLLGVVDISALRIAVYKSLVNLQKTYLKLLLVRRIL